MSRTEYLPAGVRLSAASTPADVDHSRQIRAIVLGLVASCLFLQRFGLPFGAKSIDVVGPVGFALMGLGIFRGAIAFDRRRLATFAVLTLLAIGGLYVHVTTPDSFAAAPEFSSLLQFLAMSGFAVFCFTEAMPEETFFRLINGGLILVALAGLLQFALQTAGLALLSSASGTGWLVLGSFLITACFSMGMRGVATAAIVGLTLVAVLAGVALLQPEFAATLVDRLDEVTRQGTSGHLRFVTPFWMLGDILSRQPQAVLFGLGAGVSERLTMPYEFTVNTPVKIIAEYGLPALLAYVCLFLFGEKTHVQRALTAPALVLLLLTGGYQQFPPILFFIGLLLCVARLTPAAQPKRQA